VCIRADVHSARNLLSRRDQTILGLVVLVQFLLALLDLVGVALLGVVAALGSSALTGQLPTLLLGPLETLGLQGIEPITLTFTLAAIAGAFLILKSLLSVLLMRRVYLFLAGRHALISGRLAMARLSRPLLDVHHRSSQESAYALTVGVNTATVGVPGSAVLIAAETAVLVALVADLVIVDPGVTIFMAIYLALVGLLRHRALFDWAGK
jgi:hypothetical protein